MSSDSLLVAEFAARIGIAIRSARLERGWTMADLSSRLSVTRKTLSKVEKGDPTVSFGTVLSAALATRVDVAEIINMRPDQIATHDRELERLTAQLPERVRTEAISDDF